MMMLIFLGFLLFGVSGHDMLKKSYCTSKDFRLDCNRTRILAIHEALFTNDAVESNKSCSDATNEVACTEDVRTSVNNRCSGMSHCHYNLTEDFPGRKCTGDGVITISYACITADLISMHCNSKVKGPWGYIASPGYPRFYPLVPNCKWTIESSEGRELIITILDLAMRPRKILSRGLDLCLTDSLTLLEGRYKLRRYCDVTDVEVRKPLLTDGNEITVKFFAEDFSPSRGFLLYYRFHGCPTVPAPQFGYMVYRNKSAAFYMCCKDHVFSDTMETSRVLLCVDDFRWNIGVGTCLTLEEISTLKTNSSLATTAEGKDTGTSDVVGVHIPRPEKIEDIIIPAASIVGLIVGNVGVVCCMKFIRKKRKASSSNHAVHNMAMYPRVERVSSLVSRAPQVLMTDL